MKKDVAEFVSKCLVCQKVKVEHGKPTGLMQRIELPTSKWEHIAMDFVTGLPKNQKGNDVICVIVDRLTKATHFIAFRINLSMVDMTKKYINEAAWGPNIYILSRIETHVSLRDFGIVYKKPWDQNSS